MGSAIPTQGAAQGQLPLPSRPRPSLGDAGGWGKKRSRVITSESTCFESSLYQGEKHLGMELVGVNELEKLLWLMGWHF